MNRTRYMADYYDSRRAELNALAKDKYRQKAIERTIADLKLREPNYSKTEVSERLLQAGTIGCRRTIIIRAIIKNLRLVETEY